MARTDEETTPAAGQAVDRALGGTGDETGVSASRIGSLRGAPVADVDARRLRTTVVGICSAALAVTAALLFVAGARHNDQVAALHDGGSRVTVTVNGCRGLLGGSGSNPVAYACRGTFTLDGEHESVSIPGTALRRPGSTVTLVADPSDPALVASVSATGTDRPSEKVFVLPSVLVAVLAGLGVAAGCSSGSGGRPAGRQRCRR